MPGVTFVTGPPHTWQRGTPWDDAHAWVYEDDTLLTARWAGDCFLLARRFQAVLE